MRVVFHFGLNISVRLAVQCIVLLVLLCNKMYYLLCYTMPSVNSIDNVDGDTDEHSVSTSNSKPNTSSLSSGNTTTTKKGHHGSIMVVDDEYDIVNLIKQSLERNRFKVCSFTDTLLALDHFNSHSNDYHRVVISDIRMPGMNGYEFIRKVKESNPKVKVVLMSAFEINDKEFYNVLSDIKVDGFLQKPFSIQQLNNIVEKINIKTD
jgi:CheY-like chemotaxis protein